MRKTLTILIIIIVFFDLKISAQANFQWAKQMGGGNNDFGNSIAVDASGNVYTTGFFEGTVDFDPGVGVYNLISAGQEDIFISKLDASGTFVWAKSIGQPGYDIGYSIAVDAGGNVYTTGVFSGISDFDPGLGVYTLTSTVGKTDVFISKLDAAGNFVLAKNMGGTADVAGYSVAVDAASYVYTTGTFTGTADFDPGAGIYNLTALGFYGNVFISKLDASCDFVWAKSIGATTSSVASGANGIDITIDATGNVYTTGFFNGIADFDPGSSIYNLTSLGDRDVFVSKLDVTGNFVWVKQMGGASTDGGNTIAVDPAGNIYTTGYFFSTADFDPDAGVYNFTSAGVADIFISKLDATGAFVWAKQIGGTNGDSGYSIAVDAIGSIYTTGLFSTTVDFDPGAGVYTFTSAGTVDFFVSKLDASGAFVWAKQMGGANADFGTSVTVDMAGNVYTAGYFSGTGDFDPGVGMYNLTSLGGYDIFVVKLDNAVGIEETFDANNNLISVYPNPTSSTLFISTKENEFVNSEIEIINYLGQTVLKTKFKSELEISELSNGVYILQLKNPQNQIAIKRLVVSK